MTEQNTQNKRKFDRIQFNAVAKLQTNTQLLPCQLLDISLKGALLKLDGSLKADPTIPYTLIIELSDSTTIIKMDVQIIHEEADHLGVKCVHIDMDSISHLKRLVELNLGDPMLLERNIAALKN